MINQLDLGSMKRTAKYNLLLEKDEPNSLQHDGMISRAACGLIK